MNAGLEHFSSADDPSTRSSLWEQVFLDHPRDVGESYWRHQRHAAAFGVEMIAGGIACLLHAIVPVVFERTASTTVVRLHERMKTMGRLRHLSGLSRRAS